MKTLLRILTMPSCWQINYQTGRSITKFINDSLDAGHRPVYIDKFECVLNGKTIWAPIENYPFAFCMIRGSGFMADRKTVFRLYDAIEDKSILCEEQDI